MENQILLNDLYNFKIVISSKKFNQTYFLNNIIHFSPEVEYNYLTQYNIYNFSDLISFNPLLSNSMKKYYIDYLILNKYNLSKNIKNNIYRQFLLPKFNNINTYFSIINKIFLFVNNNYYNKFLYNHINKSDFMNHFNLVYKLSYILKKINYPNIIFINENNLQIKDLINNIKNNCINDQYLFFESDSLKYSIFNIYDTKNREILICLYFLAYTFPEIANVIKYLLYVLFINTFNI
jgi:hypothetical protein